MREAERPGPLALWRDTARALLAPRRLVPILVVCVPLVLAQHHFSRTGAAVGIAVVTCALFVAFGPFAWRVLFPPDLPARALPPRLAAYALAGALPAAVGWWVPSRLHLGETFLTAGVNLFVSAALFWVGGWGLARDVEQEQGLARARARAAALEKEAERAQLMALRAHLDPHFLFNTLNAIAEWCREDGATAERAILDLSALLRRVLAGVRAPWWPLAEELRVVRSVLDLHGVRDPDRFLVDWDVPAPLPAAEVPPLILLPLVENAVKHGPARGHAGPVGIRVRALAEGGLEVRISNPGPFGGRRPGGEGLSMVERRLELAYGGGASFTIGGGSGEGTVAEVRMPARVGEEGEGCVA